MLTFGNFKLDIRTGELRRNGTRVRLQEQPFQILAVLLERAGEVVTREELAAQALAGRHFCGLRQWSEHCHQEAAHSIR